MFNVKKLYVGSKEYRYINRLLMNVIFALPTLNFIKIAREVENRYGQLCVMLFFAIKYKLKYISFTTEFQKIALRCVCTIGKNKTYCNPNSNNCWCKSYVMLEQ